VPKHDTTMVCTVTDPAERRRRLALVYRLLLDLAGHKQTADVPEAGRPDTSAAADAPAVKPEPQ